jgi:mannose-6-phosphate isomerase-like protein (cupin superfamily)/hydroxymethylpyrimidine pyrophosphatase-like HAD family hydrolase
MTIFYDVDGTLAAPFEAPPPLMRSLLASLETAGVHQVLCSGKNHEYLAGLARGLGLTRSSLVIAENGAVVFDWRTLTVTPLGGEVGYRPGLRDALRQELLAPEHFYEEPKIRALTFLPVGREAWRTESVLAAVQAVVAAHAPGATLLAHADGGLDILPPGVDKGSAARHVLGLLGLDEESVVACGDGVNDLPLLALGYPVTVCDAAPEVVALVQRRGGHVSLQPGPDGVAAALAHLMSTDWPGLDTGSLPVAYRPWGAWEVLAEGEGFKVKRMTVAPGHRLSLQQHRHRAEHWFVFGGEAHVTCGSESAHLGEGQTVTVPAGQPHRIENRGGSDLIVIEIQLGRYLQEDDIVRLEDDYRR